MLRIVRLLTAALAFTLLAANSASAITAPLAENPASGLRGVLEHRLGVDMLASAGRINEKSVLLYDFASDFSVAARGAAAVAGQGFRSHSALTRALGPAGPGRHWHHVVEQTPGNVARFGAQSVHNTQNVMRLDAGVHRQISGFYSSIQPQVTGSTSTTVRQWLSTQSFDAQQAFGQQVLRQFGGL